MTSHTSESGLSQLFNEETELSNQKWSAPKKLITLFVLSYVFFYMFPFPSDMIPYVKDAANLYSKAMENITLSLGRNVFSFTFDKIEMTGSGDTTFDYVSLITNFLLSVIVSVVIYILTHKQNNYSRLYSYLIVYARYYLAIYMLSYGCAKIFGSQFITPDINQLEKTYGNSTPMNLLWTFMGYSKTYSMFSGFGEVLGEYYYFSGGQR